MDGQHTSKIDIVVDDKKAAAAIKSILADLEKAKAIASSLGLGGGSPGSGGGPGAAPPGHPNPPGGAPGSGSPGGGPGGAPGGGGKGSGSGSPGAGGNHGAPAGVSADGLFIAMTLRAGLNAIQQGLTPSVSAPFTVGAGLAMSGGALGSKLITSMIAKNEERFKGLTEEERSAAGGMSRTLQGAMKVFPSILGEMASGAMALFGRGLELRYQDVMGLAQLERAQALASATGGSASMGVLKGAAAMGIGPQEAASTLASFYKQAGFIGSRAFGGRVLGADVAGVSPSSIAALASTAAAGGGATIPQAQAAMSYIGGLTRSQGLTGANVESALMAIASYTKQMAEQGINVDPENLAYTAGVLSQQKGFEGLRSIQGATKLAGMGPGAAQGLTGALGVSGLAQSVLMATALQGAGSPQEAITRLQSMTAAEQVSALEVALGPEGAQLALMGVGFTPTQAGGALAIGSAGANPPDFQGGLPSRSVGPLSTILARQTQGRLAAESATGSSANLLQTVHSVEKLLINLGQKTDTVLDMFQKVIDLANSALGAVL